MTNEQLAILLTVLCFQLMDIEMILRGDPSQQDVTRAQNELDRLTQRLQSYIRRLSSNPTVEGQDG